MTLNWSKIPKCPERESERKKELSRRRERDMGFEGKKSLSPLFTGRHQTNTPAPRTNPLSTTPTLPTSNMHSHTPTPHYTQTHKTHNRTHNHTCPRAQSHSSLHTARAKQWEIAESEREWCFGVMGGNVGVSSGIDEVLFQRLSPEPGPLCAACVNERSSGDRTRGAESQSIELEESRAELLRGSQL